jgi:hypothetical protein
MSIFGFGNQKGNGWWTQKMKCHHHQIGIWHNTWAFTWIFSEATECQSRPFNILKCNDLTLAMLSISFESVANNCWGTNGSIYGSEELTTLESCKKNHHRGKQKCSSLTLRQAYLLHWLLRCPVPKRLKFWIFFSVVIYESIKLRRNAEYNDY